MKSMMMNIIFVFHLWTFISIQAKSTPKPPHLTPESTPRPATFPVSPFARDVFLGGSCNPTTWRVDTAIPTLKKLKISFYNPQVADWSPELIAQEEEAKRLARILLFVITRQTRNTASMMEAAQLAIARRKSLVVVIDPFQQGQRISGETITGREYEALQNGLKTVQYFMERQRIPMYASTGNGINAIMQVLRDGTNVQALKLKDDLSINLKPRDSNLVDIIDLRQLFDSIVTDLSSTVGLSDALRVLQSRRGVDASTGCGQRSGSPTNAKLNFQEFWTLARQYWKFPKALAFVEKDLYIGVEAGDQAWLKTTAAPLVKLSKLSLHTGEPFTDEMSLLRHLQLITSSRIILLVINERSRALGISALAAHLIGLGATNLVLCIPPMPESVTIDGERLTSRAVADYNRGRSYLTSFAETAKIRVIQTAPEALQHAIELARQPEHSLVCP